jgi:mRNA interferase MazF
LKRGEVWWADLPEPGGSGPGYRRPVLIIQADAFNRSLIRTVIAAAITSNVALAAAPGNVALSKRSAGLTRDSVVNVSQILTLDKRFLTKRVGRVPESRLRQVEDGLRLVLSLS